MVPAQALPWAIARHGTHRTCGWPPSAGDDVTGARWWVAGQPRAPVLVRRRGAAGLLIVLRSGRNETSTIKPRRPHHTGGIFMSARAAVHSYIKTTLANLGTASDTKQHSIPAPSGAGFVASPAVAAPGFVDVAIVFARPTSRQATHPTRGFAKLNLTGLREEGLVAPPTPSQALVFPRRASPNDESKQKAPRPKPEMLATTLVYHLQQTETTTRKGRSVAWY